MATGFEGLTKYVMKTFLVPCLTQYSVQRREFLDATIEPSTSTEGGYLLHWLADCQLLNKILFNRLMFVVNYWHSFKDVLSGLSLSLSDHNTVHNASLVSTKLLARLLFQQNLSVYFVEMPPSGLKAIHCLLA